MAALWTFATAIFTAAIAFFTAFLFFVAYFQLKKLNKTSSADFIVRFKDTFFTDHNRKLLGLIDEKLLKYDGNSFEITDIDVEEKAFISAYRMDDYLGHFEDLGLFEQKKVVTLEMVYELFSFYIESSWENEEIQKYIHDQRKEPNCSDVYDKFESLYKKCLKFGKDKRK